MIELLELGGGGTGRVLAMLFEVDDFANEPGEDVEETGVFERVFGEFFFERLGIEVAKESVVLAGDDLEGGLRQSGGVVGGHHFEGGFAVGAKGFDALLLGEVALVAAGFPTGEVHFRDGIRQRRVGGLLEADDDLRIGVAIVHHGVDAVTKGFGQLGDLAVELIG